MATRVLVLADTHVGPGRLDRLPTRVWAAADEADVIVHAGDVCTGELLDGLSARAPVHAVLGNNDRGLEHRLPYDLRVDIDGVCITVVHDTGLRAGRAERVDRRYGDAGVVIYGHSHEPADELTPGGVRLFNPGSPTQRRRAPAHSIGWLELHDGQVTSTAIERLPNEARR